LIGQTVVGGRMTVSSSSKCLECCRVCDEGLIFHSNSLSVENSDGLAVCGWKLGFWENEEKREGFAQGNGRSKNVSLIWESAFDLFLETMIAMAKVTLEIGRTDTSTFLSLGRHFPAFRWFSCFVHSQEPLQLLFIPLNFL
jgi:hypothetical protein